MPIDVEMGLLFNSILHFDGLKSSSEINIDVGWGPSALIFLDFVTDLASWQWILTAHSNKTKRKERDVLSQDRTAESTDTTVE